MDLSLERFFELSRDMLCIAGTDGFFKRVNPVFEQTLGWKERDLLGAPFFDFIHPDDVAATAAELDALSGGAPTISFRNRYRTAANSYRTLQWTAQPVADQGLIYAIARHVTNAERAEERTRVALETSPAGMMMVDESGRILIANAEACRLFG